MNKTFSNQAGNLILELRRDTMSAWLTIKKSNKLINENDILALIESAGIKTGFDEAHNAAVDIWATAKCFWELRDRKLI